MQFLQSKILDAYQPGSLAWQLRQKRFELFRQWLQQFPRPLKILDVGGTPEFWESMGFENQGQIHITLLNVAAYPVNKPRSKGLGFTSLAGDAIDLSRFADKSFDVVFSNSVIEHVGNDLRQWQMAREICRVGKAYFVQTPNLYFPIEAHFYFPFFQFLPIPLRAWLLYYFDLTGGGLKRTLQAWQHRLTFRRVYRRQEESWERCVQRVRSVRLMGAAKFRNLFPNGTLHTEKFLGLSKSFILYSPPLKAPRTSSRVIYLPSASRAGV